MIEERLLRPIGLLFRTTLEPLDDGSVAAFDRPSFTGVLRKVEARPPAAIERGLDERLHRFGMRRVERVRGGRVLDVGRGPSCVAFAELTGETMNAPQDRLALLAEDLVEGPSGDAASRERGD